MGCHNSKENQIATSGYLNPISRKEILDSWLEIDESDLACIDKFLYLAKIHNIKYNGCADCVRVFTRYKKFLETRIDAQNQLKRIFDYDDNPGHIKNIISELEIFYFSNCNKFIDINSIQKLSTVFEEKEDDDDPIESKNYFDIEHKNNE